MSSLVRSSGELPTFPQYQAETEQAQQVPTVKVVGILFRRKWLILGIMALISLPAGLIILTLPSYFDAQSLLVVEFRKTEFSDLQASVSNVTGDSLVIRTQTDILMSPEMAGRVVDKLDLVQTPSVQRILSAPPTMAQRLTDFLEQVNGPQETRRPLSQAEKRQVAINWLRARTTIANDGRSYTISITARTDDGALSARIANAYAELYLDFMRDLKIRALTKANVVIDQQIAPLQQRVETAEQAIEAYREKNGLILSRTTDNQTGLTAGLTIADQQISQINSQLITAENDLSEKQSHLRQAQAALSSGGGLDAVPEVVASPLIQRMREQQADLNGRLASLGQTQLSNNPAMKGLSASSADLSRRIAAEVSKIVSSLQGSVNAAQSHVVALQQTLAAIQTRIVGQSQAEVKLRQLLSEADAARVVYREYLARYEQTSSQAALQEPDANLVSKAEAPNRATGPMRAQLIALATIVSATLGSILALAVERLRGGLRTVEQLEAETGLASLGFVPVADERRRARLEQTTSVYTTAVNHVRTMLSFGDTRYRANVVLVTSASINEGKTFFAISLAASVGRDGGQALLIDADARHPQVLTSLGKVSSSAIVNTEGNGAFSRIAYCKQALPGVDVVTFNKSNLSQTMPIAPAELKILIEEARGRYDFIVLDTPPVLVMPEAPVMGSLVDGAIMVVRWRHTSAFAVRRALRTLAAYRVRLLGGVLTRVRLTDLSAAEGGSQRYGARSGYSS